MKFDFVQNRDARKIRATQNARQTAAAGSARARAGEVGDALRTVYDDALNEDIPPEMLDLLGKLG